MYFLNESSNVNIFYSNFSHCFFGIFLLNSSFIDLYKLSTRDNYIGLNIEEGYSDRIDNFDSYQEPIGMLLDSTSGNFIYNSKSIDSIDGLVLKNSNNNYFDYLFLENILSYTLIIYRSSNNIFSNISTQYSLENGISGSYSKNNIFENVVCKNNNRSVFIFMILIIVSFATFCMKIILEKAVFLFGILIIILCMMLDLVKTKSPVF